MIRLRTCSRILGERLLLLTVDLGVFDYCMPTSAELVIERYDPESVPGLRDEVLAVYAASHADQMRDPWFRPEPFWERLIGLYLPGRHFEIVARPNRRSGSRLCLRWST